MARSNPAFGVKPTTLSAHCFMRSYPKSSVITFHVVMQRQTSPLSINSRAGWGRTGLGEPPCFVMTNPNSVYKGATCGSQIWKYPSASWPILEGGGQGTPATQAVRTPQLFSQASQVLSTSSKSCEYCRRRGPIPKRNDTPLFLMKGESGPRHNLNPNPHKA